MAKDKNLSTIFALLSEDKRAVDVLREASSPERSKDRLVRAVIGLKLGFIYLAKARPDDAVEERVIRLKTRYPRIAGAVLNFLPGTGVKRVASTFEAATLG